MKKITIIVSILVTSYCCYSSENLENILNRIATQPELKPMERVQILEQFIRDNSNSQQVATARIIRGFNLLGDPFNIKKFNLENEFKEIANLNRNKWEEKIAEFALLNVLHVDGKNEEVIKLGERLIESSYFNQFSNESDSNWKLLTNWMPLNPRSMKEAVIRQLEIAYDKVGDKKRAEELKSKPQSKIPPKSSFKSDATTTSQATVARNQQMQPETSTRLSQQSIISPWLWVIGFILLVTAGLIGIKLLRK